jgi:CRP-like cAMP-binding protein
MLSDMVWGNVFAGPVEWPRRSRLFRQDEIPALVFLLDRGLLSLTHLTHSGRECTIDIKHAPALVGAPFVIAQQPSIYSAIAITDCSLRWCSGQAFVQALSAEVTLAAAVHRLHCAEIMSLGLRIADMGLKSSEERLRHFWRRFARAKDQEKVAESELPLKQLEIASYLNVTPEHMSRLIRKMAKAKAPQPDESVSRHMRKKIG